MQLLDDLLIEPVGDQRFNFAPAKDLVHLDYERFRCVPLLSHRCVDARPDGGVGQLKGKAVLSLILLQGTLANLEPK